MSYRAATVLIMSTKTTLLPHRLLSFFAYFIKQEWLGFAAMQFFYFAWSIDHTLFPYLLGLLIDTITTYDNNRAEVWPALTPILLMGLLLWIGLEIGYRLSGFMSVRVIPKMEASVRLQMFDYVQRHSHTFFSKNFSGDLSNKIAEMPRTMTSVLHLVMSIMLPCIVAVFIACLMIGRLRPIFALILLVWLTAHALTCLFFARKCAQSANIHAAARSSLVGKIVDSFTNHPTVKLFSRHTFETQHLAKFQQNEQEKHRTSLYVLEQMKVALGIVTFLGQGLALNGYLFYSWQQGEITTGDVVFIFNTNWNITMMAWITSLELPAIYRDVGSCQQALSTVQEAHEIVDASEAVPLKIQKGEINFENVSFHYTPNQIIFRNKNITLNAGEKVGLVGFSGSGKSTFVHLILRYFDVEDGRILIDGQDISLVSQDSLRAQIALIPQDISLFHRSLLENIRYGNLEATDEDVIEAAKKANCHEFIEKLSHKYHTQAGERGIQLSGGQRQRIAIARAILKNPPILIFDEATSALDSVTEKQIQDSLSHLMEGRTCLVVAHRLSTLSGMDRILMFKDGEIVEDGTHEELLAAEGHYAAMWDMQAGGFLPEE